jgi:hypothetical protein
MTDTSQSARLLAFPARDDDRLRLALRSLITALDAQRQAVAGLRGELSGLSSSLQGLDSSFSTYRAELNSTATALREAGDGARTLERTAEDWVSATRV